MGRHVVRTVGELGRGLVLAPERFDPRRRLAVAASRRLGEVVEVTTGNLAPSSLPPTARALVLDTTHAWEGFVLARHAPVAPAEIGSAKRALRPGDVIVSRLRPYLRQVAFVDDGLFARVRGGNAVLASTEFYVLRGRPGFDAAALVPYLLSAPVQAALAAGQEGGHHPRFERTLLEELALPRFVASRAGALAAEVRARARTLRDTLDGARAQVADLDRRFDRRR